MKQRSRPLVRRGPRPAPMLTFVTSVKGRLEHLKQALPTWLEVPNTRCVVVDYSCPERSGDWVEASFPEVQVVRARRQPRFRWAHAQNLGAAVVTTPWICFVDCDVKVVPREFALFLGQIRPGNFYCVLDRAEGIAGTLVCAREDFQAVGGFDEVIFGYGLPDLDFWEALDILKRDGLLLPKHVLHHIDHDDVSRVRFYGIDKMTALEINSAYVRIKNDLVRLSGGFLPLPLRKSLYEAVRREVLRLKRSRRGRPTEIEVELPDRVPGTRWTYARRISFRLQPPE